MEEANFHKVFCLHPAEMSKDPPKLHHKQKWDRKCYSKQCGPSTASHMKSCISEQRTKAFELLATTTATY